MKKINIKNRNYIIIGLCLLLVLMAVGFAAFAQQLQINGTSNITSSWDIRITGIRAVNLGSVTNNGAYDITEPSIGSDNLSASFQTGLKSPGDTRIYEIEVTNSGSLDAEVTTIFTNTLSEAVHFSYDGVGPLGGSGTDVLTNAGVYNTASVSSSEPFSLPATTNNVRYIYMTVKYRDSVTSQPSNLTASINLKLNAVQASGTVTPADPGLQTIHAAGIDFPVASTGDGLYYDENTGEYYFRGANPNNYIYFSGDVWRIMSISPQGNLKIIKEDRIDLSDYSGVKSDSSVQGRFDASGATGRRTSGYCSNTYAINYGCNAWAAMSNFANIGTGGNDYSSGAVTADSELNTYLNGTYKSSLSDKSFIAENMTWNVGSAGVYNDTLSISELENMEKVYTWTGDIALATKSEYIRAHGNSACLNAKYINDNKQNDICKTTNYLYKSDYWYWLLSPYSTFASRVFYAGGGLVYYGAAYNQSGSVRPVLHLKSNITLSGNGGQASEDMYRLTSGHF